MNIRSSIHNGARAASATLGAALTIATAPGIPDATLTSVNAPQNVQEAAITLSENTHDALVEGVQARTDGEDAAGADPVAEPEQSIASPPPEGSTWEAIGAWTDAVDTSEDAGLAEDGEAAEDGIDSDAGEAGHGY